MTKVSVVSKESSHDINNMSPIIVIHDLPISKNKSINLSKRG